ncbi:cytochrome c oxidase assembly protein subunit 15 [Gemmobacter megaterium]|uniref:Heme A synthase n=1 Tax=Gemmobacter megaterium TaxID=1086013 RepID=A0A1N7PV69_9RHOB|nr:heme A synthase [Gemmobacter megaterium]GGE21509.1 heme A synthase [Gemmobacter megaterium]SIT14347.1 cytochrome c oxidase assembly protein subunit 15 [Gemmobacter megaterium]
MAKPRSIFEEVQGNRSAVPTGGGMIDQAPKGSRGAVRVWLVALFLMVMAMIAVGGATRLTDSGLSITEWRPVTGALPPMSEAHWQQEFDKYRLIPQYELVNKGMSLSDFKTIYWWEWGHRQLGRLIGLVWGVGLLYFWLSRRIPPGWTGRLIWIGALGGLQGAIGWWMVSSGLTGEMVRVASYRLAVHLGLAFVILGFIAWYVLLLGRSEADLMQARRGREGRLFSITTGLVHFAFLQILLGALVAGIDAGRAFPTWPDMNGEFFPSNALYVPDGGQVWRAFFENEGMVQFLHRMSGYLLFVFGLVVWNRGRKSPHVATRRAYDWVAVMLFGQVVLGIAAVLTAAHLHVALTHQVGAVILWVLILRARHLAQYPVAGSIRKGTA